MPFIDVASATPEKTIPVVLDKPVGSVNTCRFRNKKSDIET